MSHVYTVREITGAIKGLLEQEFPFLWVRGQVSNLSRPGSGHIYFSLKDENALLGVVWFKGSQEASATHDPLTGEVLEPGQGRPDMARMLSDGQDVMVGGRINVYPPRGQYQMVAQIVEDMGLGKLHLEFEALKRKLGEAGYFDQERKRPLPYHPVRVALVTAPDSAAAKDFLRLAGERGWGASIRVHPTLVQGEGAAAGISRAVARANRDGWAQVIVLARGGGSLEDLWAFNTEPVAESVFRSAIPVVSAVGHEVDWSISDHVADVRAATPSHAAQMLWPDRHVLVQELDGLRARLDRFAARHVARHEEQLAQAARHLAWLSPLRRLERLGERAGELDARLARAGRGVLQRGLERLDRLDTALDRCMGPEYFDSREQSLDMLRGRLGAAAGSMLRRAEQDLAVCDARLAGADPERPLERGYALVTVARDGKYLRSTADVRPGDRLDIAVRDGVVPAEVAGPRPAKKRRKPKPDDQGQLVLS